jgi:hypothetical protein
MLDPSLAAHGLGTSGQAFKVDQLDRTALTGVTAAAPGVVGCHPPFEVRRPAGVKCPVRAFDDVAKTRLRFWMSDGRLSADDSFAANRLFDLWCPGSDLKIDI